MDSITSRLTSIILVISILHTPGDTAKFKCPSFTKLTSDSFVYPDPAQCDKYWTCISGESTRSLCPDGLVFHPDKENGEDPCDLRHNVPDKCEGRDQLQRAKPGDGHCPRQNGVYASDDPYECDTYYSCLNGKSSPTKCAQGLHYSDDIGTCVWPRESGRDDCINEDSQSSGRKKKQKSAKGPEATTRKPAEALSNGFQCPGGAIGVHPALPHPSDCRLYYICLDGLTPTDAGCTKGKVFNPTTQQCDTPANVEGCEFYYNPAAKKKKEKQDRNIASQVGADVSSDEFSQFLKLLKMTGVLGGNSVNDPLKTGLRGNRFKQGGRVGGGRRKRPKNRRPRPRPRRPIRPQYDYYDYDYDEYDAPRTSSAVNQPFNHQSRIGGSDHEPDFTSAQQDDLKDTVRATPIKTTQQEVRRKPIEQIPLPTSSRTLFPVPKTRKNILTSRFIPKVKSIGKPKNIHQNEKHESVKSAATEKTMKGPVQPAKAAVVPELTGKEAEHLFTALFPTLTSDSSKSLSANQPLEVAEHVIPIKAKQENVNERQFSLSPLSRARSRTSLFKRRPFLSTDPLLLHPSLDELPEQTTTIHIPTTPQEKPIKQETSTVQGRVISSGRQSLFSTRSRLRNRQNRQKEEIATTIPTPEITEDYVSDTKASKPKALPHFRMRQRFPLARSPTPEVDDVTEDNIINIDSLEEDAYTTVKPFLNKSPRKSFRSLLTSRSQKRLSGNIPNNVKSRRPFKSTLSPSDPVPEVVTQPPPLLVEQVPTSTKRARVEKRKKPLPKKTRILPSFVEPFLHKSSPANPATISVTKLDQSASQSDITLNSPTQDTARAISRGRGRLKSQEQVVRTKPSGHSERVIKSDSSIASDSLDNIADHVQQRIIAHQVRNQLKDYLPQAENVGDAFEKLRAKVESIQNRNRARG